MIDMARTNTWDISDELWKHIEPLIPKSLRDPEKTYKRLPGAGRKPKYSNKTYFSALLYILRKGLIWNALPREKFKGLGSSALHRKFQQWEKVGLFYNIWIKGLTQYDEIKGIDWKWQSADGTNIKAPLAQQSVGPNPTDRGKKWNQKNYTGRRTRRSSGNRYKQCQQA